MRSRSAGVAWNGTRSLSWKLTPHAPSSESFFTLSTGLRNGRTISPKGSRPWFPTVQRPKLNLSSLRGAYWSLVSSCVNRAGIVIIALPPHLICHEEKASEQTLDDDAPFEFCPYHLKQNFSEISLSYQFSYD